MHNKLTVQMMLSKDTRMFQILSTRKQHSYASKLETLLNDDYDIQFFFFFTNTNNEFENENENHTQFEKEMM